MPRERPLLEIESLDAYYGYAHVLQDVSLLDTIRGLAAAGVSILLIEQNLGVATSVADRLLVMVAGRIGHETTAAEILVDEEAQQRFLGVASLAETSA